MASLINHPNTPYAMPKFTLPIGFEITSLKADINARCFDGGPFRHPIEYQLERFRHPETQARGRFKIRQMAYNYTDQLMEQFPELQGEISYATLAEQIVEKLIKEAR